MATSEAICSTFKSCSESLLSKPHGSLFLYCWLFLFVLALNLDELTHEGLVHVHHRTVIIEIAHIARSAKYGYQASVCEKFIAILNYLMRT
jgi:hypothetical protein